MSRSMSRLMLALMLENRASVNFAAPSTELSTVYVESITVAKAMIAEKSRIIFALSRISVTPVV